MFRLILTTALIAATESAATFARSTFGIELFLAPGAGVALAALVVWGRHLWPGVWLGAFIACPWSEGASLAQLALAGACATAIAVQALFGATALRWLRRLPVRHMQDALLWGQLIVMGPVASMVAPTIQVYALTVLGRLAPSDGASEWVLLWANHALGVLVFAPVCYRLFRLTSHSREKWGDLARVAVPLFMTALLLGALHVTLLRFDSAEHTLRGERTAEEVASIGFESLPLLVAPLLEFEHVIAATGRIDRQAFKTLTATTLLHPAITGIDWAPRVLHAEREQFERDLRALGAAGLGIYAFDTHERRFSAASRADYYPVLYSESGAGGAALLGLDHGFQAERRAVIGHAFATNRPAVTSVIELIRTDRASLLMVVPIDGENPAPANAFAPGQRSGLIVTVIDLAGLFEPLLEAANRRDIGVRVSDVTDPGVPRLMFTTGGADVAPTQWREIDFAGRAWRLEMWPTVPVESKPGYSALSRLYLIGGVGAALLVVFSVLASVGRRARSEALVVERTAALARELEEKNTAQTLLRAMNVNLDRQIVERNELVRALEARENELRAVVDHLFDCVIQVDAKGLILQANAALERVFGHSPADVIGTPISRLLTECGGQQSESAHSSCSCLYQAEAREVVREMSGRHRGGHAIELEYIVTEFTVEGMPRIMITLRDITERKRFIAELEAARMAAEEGSRAKSAFLATMSHEIRTPMNGVLGMSEILANGPLSDEQADLVDTIRGSAKTLLGVIDDILDFSKIEAGRLEIERAPVALPHLVESVASALLPVAERRDVDLTVFVSPALPPQILSDDVRLRQILFNLIGNAIKFSSGQQGRRGRVSIRAEMADAARSRIAFVVADNGIGIDPVAQSVLFTPFTQAEGSTTRRFGGTGLGLAISKRLVDLMGGEIALQSTAGHGARFTVTLPLEAAPEVSENTVEAPLEGLTCVVIEGGDLDAHDLGAYLEDAGARVRYAHDLRALETVTETTKPVVAVRSIGRQDTLAQARPVAVPEHVRLLNIERGRRRLPRLDGDQAVTLDGDALRRQALVRGVLVTAGRASPPMEWQHLRSDAAAVRPPAVGAAQAGAPLILVAEDDAINRKVISRQLALLGYSAEIASDGEEALAMWHQGQYALLLTDVHMPRMDGYALTRAIRAGERGTATHLPILALTANALRDEGRRARDAGMDDFLTKPLQLESLREALSRWMPAPESPPFEAKPNKDEAEADLQVIDWSAVRRVLGDNEEVIRELLGDFVRISAERVAEIIRFVTAGDTSQSAGEAHKLKSSSRAIGAMALGAVCEEIEAAANRGNLALAAANCRRLEVAHQTVTLALHRALGHVESGLD